MADTKQQKTDPQQPSGDPSPHGGKEVAQAINEAAEKGYFGSRPDPTPLEHYALPGVLSGKPTPETDPELAGKALARTNIEDGDR